MPDYKQGKIYAIRSYQTDQVYIGSTTQPLYKRLYAHKLNYKIWMKGEYDYTSSFEIVKYDDHYIELIEEYPCENKMQMDRREGQIIRSTEGCVNMCIAGRTQKEWVSDNKEHVAQKKREWVEKIENMYYNKKKNIVKKTKNNYHKQKKRKIHK